MTDIIAKLQAFVAHPEVDSMKPVWSLSQDDAREILDLIDLLSADVPVVNRGMSFREVKEAARRNGVDADALMRPDDRS